MEIRYITPTDVDIKGFFDNVNHSKLIRQMWTLGIRDKQLICIIKGMLKAPIVKQWLKDRLSLEISEEKSKVVNLKKLYSEFLGFKLKAVRKGGKFVVSSHMSDKAAKRETEKLKKQIKAIEFCKDTDDEIRQIKHYNATVFCVHNYYRYVTLINSDCAAIQFQLSTVFKNRRRTIVPYRIGAN